jgi:hypothetical protein
MLLFTFLKNWPSSSMTMSLWNGYNGCFPSWGSDQNPSWMPDLHLWNKSISVSPSLLGALTQLMLFGGSCDLIQSMGYFQKSSIQSIGIVILTALKMFVKKSFGKLVDFLMIKKHWVNFFMRSTGTEIMIIKCLWKFHSLQFLRCPHQEKTNTQGLISCHQSDCIPLNEPSPEWQPVMDQDGKTRLTMLADKVLSKMHMKNVIHYGYYDMELWHTHL